MSIHTKALQQACSDLGLTFESIGKTGIFLGVDIKGKKHYFIANQVPLNNTMSSMIAEDKGHSYDLLHPVIKMPKTLSFLDPNARELFQPYVTYTSTQEIVEAAEKVFAYPLIVKRNSGSQGLHVYKCSDRKETTVALEKIFDQHTIDYDHVALVQEYVKISKEYRVTVLDKQIELMYQKDNSSAEFVGNLSPLHWEGAQAVLVDDAKLKQRVAEFIEPIFAVLDLVYGGLDIAIDDNDVMWLFEINSAPAYDHLVQDTDMSVLVGLYTKMLRVLEK